MNLRDIKIILSISIYAYIVPIILVVFLIGIMYFTSIIPSISISKEDQTIVNYGYLGSFLSGTLGIVFTAGTLVFLAKTLNFERRKSDQDNFDSKFFLMLETLENIKYKINEDVKSEILKEINQISEFTIEKTLEESKKIIHKNNSQIGHYFRMLYQVLKMVDQNKEKISEFRNVEITYYTNILRSTLDFKLTQILAINTYCSESFDGEYNGYAEYVRNYNFFEHMPFCINSNNISESLLAVYLNCDKGFGESSFVNKLNKYVIKSIKSSVNCGYTYDLKYSFLKRLVGEWEIKNIFLKISIHERSFVCKLNGRKWDGELINTYPDSDKFIKCDIFNYGGYDIFSYFDEELKFNIFFDESSYMEYGSLDDFREVRLQIISDRLGDLSIGYVDNSIMDSDYIFSEPITKAEKLS
ncbi:putative phage abortive infection protein [Acinetobacter johnsonii]|uniref:putative phage abortive infection protein n=1 Tax=Acinetobacter johnsonii TaxID=40214 RepID=UPI002FD949C6|nr:putative phage abortive infection protein [Acinetobacter johnsonii]